MRHLDCTEDTVICRGCGAETVLPKDDETWPPPMRSYLGGGRWDEAPAQKRRPDGSLGVELPPHSDAMVDFILRHLPCGPPCEDLPALEDLAPRRAPARCVLGPVTIEPDELYRVVVIDGDKRERWHYECLADAEAAAQGARAAMAGSAS